MRGFSRALDHKLLLELELMGIREASMVQHRVIPMLLEGRSGAIVAPTGSGKTLAYLLPTMHRLHAESLMPRASRPRAIVLVPSRELCAQVAGDAKRLAKALGKMRVEALVGGASTAARRNKRDVVDQMVDLLVCTPGILLKMRYEERVFTSDVGHVVVDEADTLFGKGFREDTEELLRPIGAACVKRARHLQVVAMAATLNSSTQRAIAATLKEIGAFSPMPAVRVEGSHQVPATLREQWIRVVGGDKLPSLMLALESSRWKKCLVFVNGPDCARAVEYFLLDKGFTEEEVHSFHGEIPASKRQQFFRDFAQNPICRVLVCTDAASRGLDLEGGVDLVINFDMPGSAVDYIHRVGRTARMGRVGECFSLLQTKRDRAVAALIQGGGDLTSALEGMD